MHRLDQLSGLFVADVLSPFPATETMPATAPASYPKPMASQIALPSSGDLAGSRSRPVMRSASAVKASSRQGQGGDAGARYEP